MHLRLAGKLFINFFLVIALIGIFTIWGGIHFIADGIIKQVQSKVKSDLNVAREIYQENLDDIRDIIRLTSRRFFIREDIQQGRFKNLRTELEKVRREEFLDILTLTDSSGRVLVSSRNPKLHGEEVNNQLMRWVVEKREVAAATTLIPVEEISKESEELAQLAGIEIIPTPRAKTPKGGRLNSGMFLLACSPVLREDGRIIGILYGGKLLNQNYVLVDKIKDIVFKGETYKGREIGTATIFQGDVRIATNVFYQDGRRAIGTRVAEDVFRKVLEKGNPFVDRAFVVEDWYIAAYEPIRDITGQIVGILYVGIREEKYVDMKKRAIITFVCIVLIGVGLAMVVSFLFARSVVLPLRKIVLACRRIAQGDFSSRVELKSKDEIEELARGFNFMASSLKERDDKLKEATSRQLIRSERLATLGQLAAGVAHEINNPIAGIITYLRLIQKKLGKNEFGDGEMRRYLEIIEKETTRIGTIVRHLLDFARQSEPNLKPVDIHLILNESLELLAHKFRLQGIEIEKNYGVCPQIIADFAQLQQTFMNIIINACEAMEDGGKLTITTRVGGNNMVEIEFSDTGKGIPPENLHRIFDPFFTTKPKGTGLGLSVVYGIIMRHQGEINVKSEVNKGTTFTIRLPVSL